MCPVIVAPASGKLSILWSAPKNARLTEMWNDGISIREISRTLHCTMPAVQRQVRALGLTLRDDPKLPPKVEPKPVTPRPLPPGAHTLPPLPSEET
jgi:hypothetical protein